MSDATLQIAVCASLIGLASNPDASRAKFRELSDRVLHSVAVDRKSLCTRKEVDRAGLNLKPTNINYYQVR